MGDMKLCSLMLCLLVPTLMVGAKAQRCGREFGGAVCGNGLCCSQYGWCGNSNEHCGTGCQSQCQASSSGDISSIISPSLFEEMLKHRNNQACPGRGFYTYDAFITAARSFRGFGTTGDTNTRKREMAAFFGQTSHETTGGWPSAPDGPYAWGYCFINERNQQVYCSGGGWPCAPGKSYYGRGPIQLTHNYNYGLAGSELGLDLTNDPDLVARDRNVAFRTAIWFWMRPQGNKPSSHNVITGGWTPSAADTNAGRLPGYGVITNIINGGLECGRGPDSRVQSRIGFYQRYCQLLGVSPGNNLDCNNQAPF
ncbi:endochitinase-like [Vigna unguiculata]|uniref:chitinase n=1 Tax=Vigna unguiculata TaxID=3917 RepID=A0A4D6KZF5_VIGUN|nr:endochitinase-like [Vigna unguiculata]XP_027920677.1 endochitinase-like [Vigna unguiculata]QCD82135.1 chitinase [Vigna unguiculata]